MRFEESKAGRKGLIFNIQRFSVHDGPGIRTTVFMKGCPLGCLWCSNPESQDLFPNLMTRDINCKRCGACAEVCRRGAVTVDENSRQIDREKCDNCLECVNSCSYGSLVACGRYYDPEEVVEEVLKDRDFYENSGGGVTVSGGEPLLQPAFVSSLLDLCKKQHLHTALDTTGYAPWEVAERVLRFVDLVLFDVKHLDPERHKTATGVDNHLIMENLKRVSKNALIWLRIPLIAGFNDSQEEIRKVAKLAEILGVAKISLLPYHEGGMSKSYQLGRKYHFAGATAPSDEHVELLKEIIEREGITACVGK